MTEERDPFKEATPRMAMIAIAMVFVIGLLVGFVLGRTL